ncbi:MAG: hypothetical protein AAGD00_00630 [Planctomycetota bacterium]
MKHNALMTFAGGLVVGAIGLVVVAGDLNPPAGPVMPTGRTTTEIFDAVVAQGMGPTTVSSLQPAVAGDSVPEGQLTFAWGVGGSAGTGVSNFFEAEFGGSVPIGMGGAIGPLTPRPLIVRKRYDSSSDELVRIFRDGIDGGTVTIVFFDEAGTFAGQARFSGCAIAELRYEKAARNDGAFPLTEVVTIMYGRTDFLLPDGSSASINY